MTAGVSRNESEIIYEPKAQVPNKTNEGYMEKPIVKARENVPTVQDDLEQSTPATSAGNEQEDKILLQNICETVLAGFSCLCDEYPDVVRNVGKDRYHVDLKAAQEAGIRFYKLSGNRNHGTDQKKTSSSVQEIGAQQTLMVINTTASKECGVEYECFESDPNQNIDGFGFVILDGNGRIESALNMEEFPAMDAVTPRPNADGTLDLPAIIQAINVNVAKWKTQDHITMRRSKEGTQSHPGWEYIQQLLKKGYNYQAACQLVTLKTDRIKANDVVSGNADNIFESFDTAQYLIENSFIKKFGEGRKSPLFTRDFTKKLVEMYHSWSGNGEYYATTTMAGFVASFTEDEVSAIINAKSNSSQTKDQVRLKVLIDRYNDYVKSISKN